MLTLTKKLLKHSLIIALVASPLMLTSGELERHATSELLDVMQFEKTMNETMSITMEMMKKSFPENEKSSEVLAKFFKEYLSPESLREETIQIYSEVFTENEIKDMIIFYKSETGQKTLEKSPKITKRMMQMTEKRLNQNMDKIFDMLDEELSN